MRLKKLEIYGFKSFAERTEMTFEDGITGIVGPNGCGKSNISDAVRWVLGEQSAKTLRGAKMEDVIFNGTEKRRKLSYCEVILVFDNESRSLPIDFSEVAVARRVYRNGDSEYSINQSPCRLKDVIELFRDTGIGKEGYSLIGQGRIDEILSVKSEDRRQIFEEAAGIVKYKVRKNEAERRIQNTRDNLSRVEDILNELNMRIEPLRQQSEDAREYLQLTGELKQLELNVFLTRSERYTERLQELHQSFEAMQKAIAEADAREAALTERRDAAQENLMLLEEEAAQGRDAVQGMIQKVEAGEGAVSVLKERIAALERDHERLSADFEAAQQGEGGVDKQLELLKDRIEVEGAEIESARAQLSVDEEELSKREGTLQQSEEKIEQLKQALIDTMNRMSDVRSEQARLTAMQDALTARIASLKEEEQEGETDRGGFDERVREADGRYQQEFSQKQELESLVSRSVERVRQLGEHTEELNEKVKTLTAQRQELASRLRVLEEMQRDYEGYQHSVKNVLMQAKRTQNSGVHGVVANLINVPKDLERAIDMVLGAALQNVVVDREEDAKRMIDYLRGNHLGRATFLPISAVRGRTLDPGERKVLSMPGCVGLASELIKYDKTYQGVIENLLGRTVVAKDLDSGIEIMRAGRHQFRLVTLEGDVMHSGGSMSGGSVQSRVTSLLSREREIAEHKKSLEQALRELELAQAELSKMDEERGQLKRERGELYDRLHQQEIACAREEAHLKAAQGELNAHLERSSRVLGARAQLEEQLNDVHKSLQGLSGQQGDEQQQHQDRQRQIQAQQALLFELRSDAAKLRESVTGSRVTLAAQERGLDALTADHKRLTDQRSDITRLLSENSGLLLKCEQELLAGRVQLQQDVEKLDAGKQQLEAAREVFREIEERRMGAQASIKQLGDALDQLRTETDDFTERCHRAEMQISRVEGEFKQLTDRIWEDYELSYEGAQQYREEGFMLADSEKRISQIKSRIREMGSVNVAAVDEYRQTSERWSELNTQRDDLLKAELDLQGIIEELVRKMEKQFTEQFQLLNANFQQTFVQLFGGGQAELRLVDPKDALGSGIEIVAQPPGKKLQLLSLLSGGERALTAIAILFAMLRLKPTPFCFLDEIEAALDDANIDHYAEFLKDFARKTQFVVVTHRKGTMERCDALYGVAMEEKGVSRLVSVRLGEAQAM